MQRILFETAKLAHDKGYKESCNSCYNFDLKVHTFDTPILSCENILLAPYQVELQEWLRNKGIHIEILYDYEYDLFSYHYYLRQIKKVKDRKKTSNHYQTYEETLEEALHDALKLIK